MATARPAGASRRALIGLAVSIMPIFSTTGMGVSAVKLVTHRFSVNAAL
jgi:hypothetical protein